MPEPEKNEKNTVVHIDVMGNTKEFLTSPMKETQEGFLVGEAILTNVGVFNYRDEKGGIIRELRPPEEVFSRESIETLRLLPLTRKHPKDLVDKDNIKNLQVGTTGDTIIRDSYAVSASLKITDKKTIEDIKGGLGAISCGYKADLEFTSGVWLGVQYDAIQRNIRYNHVAVGIKKGRAGDLAEFRMDSKLESVHLLYIEPKEERKNKEDEKGEEMPGEKITKKYIHDNVEYEIDPSFIPVISGLKKDIQSLKDNEAKIIEDYKKEITVLTAKKDDYKDKLEKKEKELENNKITPEKLQDEVEKRVGLLGAAKILGIDVKKDSSSSDIKKSVIEKLFPDANLKGKDEVYIDARFDSCLDLIKKVEKDTVNSENKRNLFPVTDNKDSADVIDSESAKAKYLDSLINGKEGDK